MNRTDNTIKFEFDNYIFLKSRDSAVCIANRLRTGLAGVRFSKGATDFSFLQNVQTTSGTHPVFYSTSVGVWGSFPGVKRAGPQDDHSPPSSAETERSYTSTPNVRLQIMDGVGQLYRLTYFDIVIKVIFIFIGIFTGVFNFNDNI